MKKLNELIASNNLNILFICKFGSHLYGTDHIDSDVDYKAVYLPTLEQCIVGDYPKSISYSSGGNDSRNTNEDIDIEIYSLHYFLKLLQKGDTGALDMLHAPIKNKELVLKTSDIWRFLNKNRSKFYTTNLSAFVGYCRTQASKYGIKGSRLNAAKMVLDFLSGKDGVLSDHILPEGEHIHMIDADPDQKIQFPMYQVCGKKFQVTVKCSYAYDALKKFYDAYGHRAQLAAQNEGIDWKALSHAMRCAIEMERLYEFGDIKFPLDNADYLLDIKKGNLDYTTVVAPALEMRMEYIEELAKESKYPKKINMKAWNKWLTRIYISPDRELYL